MTIYQNNVHSSASFWVDGHYYTVEWGIDKDSYYVGSISTPGVDYPVVTFDFETEHDLWKELLIDIRMWREDQDELDRSK